MTKTLRRAPIAALSLFTFATLIAAQDDWRLVAGFDVATYRGGSMSLEPGGRVLRFGGEVPIGSAPGVPPPTAITQLWNGSHWSTVGGLDPLPPARAYALLAFDSLRQRTVLHGGKGVNGVLLDDTWEWNGVAWSQVPTSTAPPLRTFSAMAFDGQRIVLFGGQDATFHELDDTWTFDGVDWHKVANPVRPAARLGHGMAGGNGEVLLFGGALVAPIPVSGETWRWDGSAWSQVQTVSAPGPRTLPALTYDPVQDRYLLFGGLAPFTLQAETWQFANSQWSQLAAERAPANNVYQSQAFHPATERWVATWTTGGLNPVVSLTSELGCDLAYIDDYGVGCSSIGPYGLTIHRLSGQPRPGETFVLGVGSMGGVQLAAIGWSDAVAPFGPLPFPLATIGAGQHCFLFNSADLLQVLAAPVMPIVIPNDSGLVGVEFYVQGLEVSGFELGTLRTTRGLACGIGLK